MKKFVLKDIIFLALLSVVLLLVSSLVMPIVMFTKIFALRQLFAAFFFSLFCLIALHRVPKIGTLTLIGIFTGAFLGFMSVIMLFNNVLGAVLTELLVLIIFRNYDKKAARFFAAIVYIPMTIPMTLAFHCLINHEPLAKVTGSPLTTLLLALATFALAGIGAFAGDKIAKELKKAGKLKC